MKFVKKLGNEFEKYFAGFFDKSSLNELKLEEIASNLRTLMEEQSESEGGVIYVPNDYEVHITLKNYRKVKPTIPKNLNEYFEEYLAKQAKLKKYIFREKLNVRIIFDRTLAKPDIKITAGFTNGKFLPLSGRFSDGNTNPFASRKENDVDQNTKIFKKINIKSPVPSQNRTQMAAVTVIGGSNAGTKTSVADTRVNIGRRPSNEMVLDDKSSSRLHAYIVCEEGSHVIYDAQSLNGTYVNDKHIVQKKLTSGDKIKIGDTVILYEILSCHT